MFALTKSARLGIIIFPILILLHIILVWEREDKAKLAQESNCKAALLR